MSHFPVHPQALYTLYKKIDFQNITHHGPRSSHWTRGACSTLENQIHGRYVMLQDLYCNNAIYYSSQLEKTETKITLFLPWIQELQFHLFGQVVHHGPTKRKTNKTTVNRRRHLYLQYMAHFIPRGNLASECL